MGVGGLAKILPQRPRWLRHLGLRHLSTASATRLSTGPVHNLTGRQGSVRRNGCTRGLIARNHSGGNIASTNMAA